MVAAERSGIKANASNRVNRSIPDPDLIPNPDRLAGPTTLNLNLGDFAGKSLVL
jgi:hypothetical protein